MQIEITGDTEREITISLTHQGKAHSAKLFQVRGIWRLSSHPGLTSIDGYSIGNRRTHWTRALELAVSFMRDRIAYPEMERARP